MFTMKKFIVLIIVFLLLMPVNNIAIAKTDYEYAMICCDNAPFYADASCSIVKFNLPKTYFVKVVEIYTNYSRVIYMNSNQNLPKVEGYVENVNLEFVDYCPNNPSPNVILTLNSDEVLFSDLINLTPKAVLSNNATANYYGEINFGGETYVYVYSQGYIGYARKVAFNSFQLPNHESYVEETYSSSNTNSNDITSNDNINKEESENVSSQHVIVISLILLAIVFIAFLFFKPNDKKIVSEAFFNDDDKF